MLEAHHAKTPTRTDTYIDASPEKVFAYVSDLTTNGDWSADPLEIEAVSDDPIGVGSEYRSVAQFRGGIVNSTLRVTEYEPSSRFSFEGTEPDSIHTHEFTFAPEDGGTRMERVTSHNLPFTTWVLFKTIGWMMVGKPGMAKAYEQLQAKLAE